jgi:hypothetical protein
MRDFVLLRLNRFRAFHPHIRPILLVTAISTHEPSVNGENSEHTANYSDPIAKHENVEIHVAIIIPLTITYVLLTCRQGLIATR